MVDDDLRPVVLVVDDEDDIRLLARVMLELAGYDIVEAANGEEAIEVLGRTRVDTMLLDLRMAPIDGWGVLEHLHKAQRLPGLRVVMVSAHPDPSMANEAVARGCAAYLAKPFDASDLLAAVGPSGDHP